MVIGSLEKELAPSGAISFFRIEFLFRKIDRREVVEVILLSKIMEKHYNTVFMIFEKNTLTCCFFLISIILGDPTVLFWLWFPFNEDRVLREGV